MTTMPSKMKRLVNYRKRSVQLPKGCKNLSDVVGGSQHKKADSFKLPNLFQLDEKIRKSKCQYCGDPAVAGSFWYATPGGPKEEAHFWCKQCSEDLKVFHSRPENALPESAEIEDEATMDQVMGRLDEIRNRKEEFMRQKVSERQGSNNAS
jgi:hypothetical protein